MKIAITKFLGYLLTPIYLIVFGILLVVFHPIQVICRNIWGYHAHKSRGLETFETYKNTKNRFLSVLTTDDDFIMLPS